MAYNVFGYGYPAGAENDPNAPYNQSDPSLDVECNLSYEVRCTQEVDLQGAYKVTDEEGYTDTITEGCDVQKDFEEQLHTPLQLIKMLQKEAQAHVDKNENARYWKNIVKECEAWDDEECTEAETN